MTTYPFYTLDVFTRQRFGGNPLAVFPFAEGLDAATMQQLAAEMNYSETTFVLPTYAPGADFQVRIFNRQHEMPFAGHPNVGTAYLLASLGLIEGSVTFEELAGLVPVGILQEDGKPVGARIEAPQPLSALGEINPAVIAGCLQIPPETVVTDTHLPARASVGIDFVLVEVSADALAAATPDLSAYRNAVAAMPELAGRLSIFAYVRHDTHVRARMFAPLAGTWEDPATGSANAALAALLLSKSGAPRTDYEAEQGVEMGRSSTLSLSAWRDGDAIRAAVSGHCVDVFSGSIEL